MDMLSRLDITMKNSRTGVSANVSARANSEGVLTDHGIESILEMGAYLWSHGWEREEIAVTAVKLVADEDG